MRCEAGRVHLVVPTEDLDRQQSQPSSGKHMQAVTLVSMRMWCGRGAMQTESRLEAMQGESGQATNGASTDDSRASRPKRARARFDYSILNGTSGNIRAFIQGSILTVWDVKYSAHLAGAQVQCTISRHSSTMHCQQACRSACPSTSWT